MACVVGSDLTDLLNTATMINLPVVVECHTEEEVAVAVENGAGTVLLNRVDRFGGNRFWSDQPLAVVGALPPGGVVTALVAGKVGTVDEARRFLDAGYDGVLVGEAFMGRADAQDLVEVRKRRSADTDELHSSLRLRRLLTHRLGTARDGGGRGWGIFLTF